MIRETTINTSPFPGSRITLRLPECTRTHTGQSATRSVIESASQIGLEPFSDFFVRSRALQHRLRIISAMDYRFKPINKTCAGTGQPLIPGSQCYSVLVEKNGIFERLDYSEEGWQGIPEGGIGCWRAQVPIPEEKRAETTDPETLMNYFEQIVENSNPHQEKICYVLALYLLQRRRLKLDGAEERDNVEYLQLSGSRGEGPFEVRDQQLPKDEISELQILLNQQLTTEWNAA